MPDPKDMLVQIQPWLQNKRNMKNEHESQKKQILAHLKAGKKITALDALHKFNCWRLSARILDLRNEGHPIETEHYHTKTDKYVARYYYAK